MATYGSTKDEKLPMVVVQPNPPPPYPTPQQQQAVASIDSENPFNEQLDTAFWTKVAVEIKEQNQKRKKLNKQRKSDEQLPLITRNEVETRLRLQRIEDTNNKEDERLMNDDGDDDEETENTLIRQYENLLALPNYPGKKIRRTYLLHLAAERNLCDIATFFLQFYPSTISKSDQQEKDGIPLIERQDERTPVQIALDEKNDDVCAIIMKSMTNERVKSLFFADDPTEINNSFVDYIKHPNMKQTVLCVLDACINPNFPYLQEDESEKKTLTDRGEELWAKIPDIPLQYNFFFQILDGDIYSRPPVDKRGNKNTAFQHNSSSGLQIIANSAVTRKTDSEEKLDPILHPVVRQLVREKWENYGRFTVIFYLVLYLFFLLNMAIALILGAMSKEPTAYDQGVDKLRGFCEIVTLLFTMFYIFFEIDQFLKEQAIYCKDIFNLLDIIGLLAIVALLPCRFAEAITVTRSVSVIAFFANFIRVFKFSVALPKEYGVYIKTFAEILYYDIIKFGLVFMVVMMTFAGSVYISLIASNSLDDDFKNFLDVFLQELRALLEGKEFADSYSNYSNKSVFLTLFVLLNMGAIIVIMSNILIGQLSYRYESAMAAADFQYDIDKAKMVTSLEKSWFPCEILNKRMKYYKHGIYVNQKDMDADLLVYWNKQTNTEEEAKVAIKSMLEKKILKRN